MSMAQRRFALVAATGIALAGALAAGAAQARDADVRWSVTIGSPLAKDTRAPMEGGCRPSSEISTPASCSDWL